MADKFARQSGGWSTGSIWDNGKVPAVGDRVFANGWTIDINQDIDVHSIRRDGTPIGASADVIATPSMTSNNTPLGYFVSSSNPGSSPWVVFNQLLSFGAWASNTNNRGTIWFTFPTASAGPIIKRYNMYRYGSVYSPIQWSFSGRNSTAEAWTALHIVSGAAQSPVQYFSPILANTASYTMYQLDITATANASYTPYLYGFEMCTDTGSAQGWSSGGSFTINSGSRNLNFSGDGMTGWAAATFLTINSTSGSIINFTKSGSGLIMNPGIQTNNGDLRIINVVNTPTINWVGDMYGPTTLTIYNRTGIFYLAGAATMNIIGNMYGSNTNYSLSCYTLTIAGNGATVNVTGNVYGSTNNNQSFGNNIYATSTANLNITGNIYCTLGNAVYINGNTKLTHVGSIQNVNTNGISAIYAGNSITSPVIVTGPIISTGSLMPIVANRLQFAAGANISWRFQNVNNQDITLYSPGTSGSALGLPLSSDVRYNILYGPNNELTGSLRVAAPQYVSQGVLTDNTTGSAQLTAADFLSAISSSSDPLAVRLRNVATVDSTGGQIAAFTP
jgi:hypothetical protein